MEFAKIVNRNERLTIAKSIASKIPQYYPTTTDERRRTAESIASAYALVLPAAMLKAVGEFGRSSVGSPIVATAAQANRIAKDIGNTPFVLTRIGPDSADVFTLLHPKRLSPFRDCDTCPEMQPYLIAQAPKPAVAAGGKIEPVKKSNSYVAVSRTKVSVADFKRFLASPIASPIIESSCWNFVDLRDKEIPFDHRAATDSDDETAANCVSYNGATAYSEWLSKVTGQRYRLPTRAELEEHVFLNNQKPLSLNADAAFAWSSDCEGGASECERRAALWGKGDNDGRLFKADRQDARIGFYLVREIAPYAPVPPEQMPEKVEIATTETPLPAGDGSD